MTSAPLSPTPQSPTVGSITPTPQHWLILMIIVVCGGSSFSGIRIAVETAPPAVVAAGRLWVATLMLAVYMKATGREMLPLREGGRLSPSWIFALFIGLAGYAVPMTLFPFAQQHVSSMLAGIYMAFMPLVTVILAATFADEPLTVRKITGFAAGTLGVIILIGPDALSHLLSDSVIAQGALLLATTGYAISSVLTRRAPPAAARSFAVAIMLLAAIAATPLAIREGLRESAISIRSWLAIVYLGLVPTGLTAILIINVVRGAGAGFMAMGNYLTPGVAIILGMLMFGETLEWRFLFGLIAILTGVAIAQPGPIAFLRAKLQRRTAVRS
ncbi:DMT family transporter [Parvularcula sp. LCG005]|uniref:DMT family transporter n=1 Tax=Parvularcula sp. LCG005 TaxID=3078805 RepID=UPI002943D17D|nr:EamA family transporter [Parvularcula sp. LCG005]WOI52354.1 EamA family transporter [Parvularcula sp. LCG005]